MTSHKRPLTVSPEESYLDNPSDEDCSEWERITQDPAKRVAFERECIEDELTNQRRVILLQDNPSSRSHCRFWDCVPRKLNGEPNIRSAFRFNVKDLSGRYYERGVLQMEGGVAQLTSASWQISRFHNAIEDWFRYKGRTFEVKIYDRFKKAHAKWERKASTVEINHQLEAHEGSSQNCEKCGKVPDEPQRKDYFPEEPHSSLLSEVLASVIGVGNLDGVGGDSNARRLKKTRRS
ncbi:hypothetical protein PENSUB_13813 [Penicillium subrubescens]|uniref:Uncharacterized protein n=1 Tax=Penicillium subrubescens TaxID=1316194 RepID=A0A1Q5SMQ8_9EURO|nr:hypothetical protein PENSUB_13813 [Penicillium subrubescens]